MQHEVTIKGPLLESKSNEISFMGTLNDEYEAAEGQTVRMAVRAVS